MSRGKETMVTDSLSSATCISSVVSERIVTSSSSGLMICASWPVRASMPIRRMLTLRPAKISVGVSSSSSSSSAGSDWACRWEMSKVCSCTFLSREL